jgi:hypothetical protein
MNPKMENNRMNQVDVFIFFGGFIHITLDPCLRRFAWLVTVGVRARGAADSRPISSGFPSWRVARIYSTKMAIQRAII